MVPNQSSARSICCSPIARVRAHTLVATSASCRRSMSALASTCSASPYMGDVSNRLAPYCRAASITASQRACPASSRTLKTRAVPSPTAGTDIPVRPRTRRSIRRTLAAPSHTPRKLPGGQKKRAWCFHHALDTSLGSWLTPAYIPAPPPPSAPPPSAPPPPWSPVSSPPASPPASPPVSPPVASPPAAGSSVVAGVVSSFLSLPPHATATAPRPRARITVRRRRIAHSFDGNDLWPQRPGLVPR